MPDLDRPALGAPLPEAAVEHGDAVVAEGAEGPPHARRAHHAARVVDDHEVAVADAERADRLRELRRGSAACAAARSRVSAMASMSKKTAPGICASLNSRPRVALQRAACATSRRRRGPPRRRAAAASHSVVTTASGAGSLIGGRARAAARAGAGSALGVEMLFPGADTPPSPPGPRSYGFGVMSSALVEQPREPALERRARPARHPRVPPSSARAGRRARRAWRVASVEASPSAHVTTTGRAASRAPSRRRRLEAAAAEPSPRPARGRCA